MGVSCHIPCVFNWLLEICERSKLFFFFCQSIFFFNQLLSLEKKEETFIKNFVILESQVFCQHFETVVDSKLCQIKIKIKIAKFAHYTNAARKRTIV